MGGAANIQAGGSRYPGSLLGRRWTDSGRRLMHALSAGSCIRKAVAEDLSRLYVCQIFVAYNRGSCGHRAVAVGGRRTRKTEMQSRVPVEPKLITPDERLDYIR